MTSEPRRVALVTSSFAPHFGGVEEHVAQVARELHARGAVVEVWTVDRGERPRSPFTGRDGAPIPVRYLKTPLPGRKPSDLVHFVRRGPRAWAAWNRAFRELEPDVLHVHCFGPNGVYAELLARRRRAPLIVTSHGETMGDDDGVFAHSSLFRSALRRSLQAASVVTAPSRFVLDDLQLNYGLRGGATVPNGVDLRVMPVATPTGERPYLFAVGRLGYQKGFDLLVRAFTAARTRDVDLVLGGDGPMRRDLEDRIREAGLEDRIRLTGQLAPGEVAAWMSSALAVVVPSRQESFGIVALEAWRAAAPLLMTSRGGAAEFVRDGQDGLLVDPTDDEALRATILRLIDEPELRARLSAAGGSRAQEFTWERVADAYEALYSDTTGKA